MFLLRRTSPYQTLMKHIFRIFSEILSMYSRQKGKGQPGGNGSNQWKDQGPECRKWRKMRKWQEVRTRKSAPATIDDQQFDHIFHKSLELECFHSEAHKSTNVFREEHRSLGACKACVPLCEATPEKLKKTKFQSRQMSFCHFQRSRLDFEWNRTRRIPCAL